MSVNIGNNNRIINSNISEKIETDGVSKAEIEKKKFSLRHPVLCSLLVSMLAGFILLFSFWKTIISFIEGLF